MSEGSLEDKLKRNAGKVKKSKVSRRFKIGFISLLALSALSVGTLLYDIPIFSKKEPQKKASVELAQGPNGMIYVDVVQDLYTDIDLWNSIRPKILESFQEYASLHVSQLSGRNFIKPVPSDILLDKYICILDLVNADLRSLGLPGNYGLRSLHNLDDLIKNYNASQVWLVSEIGIDVTGSVDLTTKGNKKETAEFKCVKSNNGQVFSGFDMISGKTISYNIKTPLICVRVEGKDAVDTHMALYAEPLHVQLMPEANKLIDHFLEYVNNQDGTVTFSPAAKANAERVAAIVDEAVVHGLSHLWLKDNLAAFGLTEKDYLQEIEQKESLIRYKGVKVIRELAAKMGRKELLDDYRGNPVKYWGIIKSQVPEYKDF